MEGTSGVVVCENEVETFVSDATTSFRFLLITLFDKFDNVIIISISRKCFHKTSAPFSSHTAYARLCFFTRSWRKLQGLRLLCRLNSALLYCCAFRLPLPLFSVFLNWRLCVVLLVKATKAYTLGTNQIKSTRFLTNYCGLYCRLCRFGFGCASRSLRPLQEGAFSSSRPFPQF